MEAQGVALHRVVQDKQANNWHWAGQEDPDDKHHPPHAPSSVKSALRSGWFSFTHTRMPLHFVAVLVFLGIYVGSYVNTVHDLPTPASAIQETSSRRTLLASNTGVQAITKQSGSATIRAAQDVAKFQDLSIHASGFDQLRPALPPADTGEQEMRAVPFQVISIYPRITYYPAFVDPERCEKVMELAKKSMFPSGLAYKPGDSIPEAQDVRTSSGTFLTRTMDKTGTLEWIEKKIAAVTHLPTSYGEAFNVLRYEPTQHYDSHYDSFDPKDFGRMPSQRIATFLIFLRAPEEGGETVFKREGKAAGNLTIADWRSCDDGLGIKVKPKQGDAVLFWSVTPDLKLDPHSLHGACPVVKGEKWSMAKWIHERPLNSWE